MELPRELEQIDQDLTNIIPFLLRHFSTPRIAEESGMNRLLDERNDRTRIIEDFERSFNYERED